MYLSNRELRDAIASGKLIVDPRPTKIDPTSIDLHLHRIREAKVWDVEQLAADHKITGIEQPELRLGSFDYQSFGGKYLVAPPTDAKKLVFRRGDEVIVKPGGFLLWQTRETVGTPEDDADLICFVNAKSTKARTGIVVHLTAPTIHSTWSGKVTLEIVNLGPFHFVLKEGDSIAQLTVARITSTPDESMKKAGSVTYGQKSASGSPSRARAKKKSGGKKGGGRRSRR